MLGYHIVEVEYYKNSFYYLFKHSQCLIFTAPILEIFTGDITEMRNIFETFDADGNGKVTEEEFISLLCNSKKCDKSFAEGIWKEVEKEGGKFRRAEFFSQEIHICQCGFNFLAHAFPYWITIGHFFTEVNALYKI